MKKALVGLAVAVVALVAWMHPVEASERIAPNTFSTLVACNGAMQSGEFRFYEPRYFGLNAQNPVNGIDRIRVPLESPQCIQMLVVGGVKYVAQREGTYFRAYRLPDGSLQLYARDDCGNPVYGVTIAPPLQPVEIAPLYQELPQIKLLPQLTPQPKSIPQAAPSPVTHPNRADSMWGITGSAMIGEFDSRPLGGALETMTGRTICMQGRDFDIGVARGTSTSTVWRLTIAQKSIHEHSFTRYHCATCGFEVETTALTNVKVWGARIEGDFRIPVGRGHGIQPMISISAGVGRIVGDAHQRTTRSTIVSVTKKVSARELMSASAFPMGGAGVGFTGPLGSRASYAVTVIGFEYPGRYYGRVTLNVWAK